MFSKSILKEYTFKSIVFSSFEIEIEIEATIGLFCHYCCNCQNNIHLTQILNFTLDIMEGFTLGDLF